MKKRVTSSILLLKNKFQIPRNVFALGWVSFFNDLASEMVYPVVPIFLTSFLGVPIAIVGVIEGIAESTSSILKFFYFIFLCLSSIFLCLL